MKIYLNGRWVNSEEAVVPFSDQGFQRGESLFETVRINSSQPFRLSTHMERMQSGITTMQIDAQEIMERIPTLVSEYIDRNQIKDALVKIMITRGSGSEPAIYLSSRDIPNTDTWPQKVIFLQEKDYPILRFHPAIKSGNYLGNMLAKRDAEAAGAFEPVFINDEGYVTECAIRNIFFVQNNTLLTPAIELGVLPGVIRDSIIELALNAGMNVEEAYIRAERINEMDEAFISSTGVGVLPVYWDGFQSSYEKSQVLMIALNQLFESGEMNAS